MKFRISNGFSRAIEFDAGSAVELHRELRPAMRSWVRPQPGRNGHPIIQLRARIVWANHWLAARLARSSITPDQERAWRAQAAAFISQAKQAADVLSRVELQFERRGMWFSCSKFRTRYQLSFDADLTLAACIDLWDDVIAIDAHLAALESLGGFATGLLARPSPQPPSHLRLVPPTES